MDTTRVKRASEWFYSTVFRDEAIQVRHPEPQESIPSAIRTARSLENGMPSYWQSRESIFVKQAKLLANYEDDYEYDKPVLRYFPTYQSLTDQELRGYFSWRTKLRRGDVRKTSLSYAFIFIYELINQIGVSDPMDGYLKLKDFQTIYGELDNGVLPYLSKWLTDYVIYYGLDSDLLADWEQLSFDKSIAVLVNINHYSDQQIMAAVKRLAPRWLKRSRFYGSYREEMERVIPRVFRRIYEHHASHCKKSMAEVYFGSYKEFPVVLFDSAVFYDQMKTRSSDYPVDEIRSFHCRNGLWSVRKYSCSDRTNAKLEDIIKTIDAVMRECYSYRNQIKRELDKKWLIKMIEEETRFLLEEKESAQAKKIVIDYSQLATIRRDAAVTQDKLIVEDDMEEENPVISKPQSPKPKSEANDIPLSKEEFRLLQSLLYGGDYSWVQAEGHMLSVLVDSINDKLYDVFMDSVLVLEDQPELIEDYIDDLKEMVHP